MAKHKYPLMQVLEVKQKRVEDAEILVREKQQVVDTEREKLKKLEEERDKVKKHKQDKIKQLRVEMDHGTTSAKIQQMKAYMKVVDERLLIEERKVKDQQVRVKQVEKELEEAKQQLFIKRQEVEKLQIHRKDWEKEQKKEEEIIESREQDELGQVIHGIRQKRK
jgi:flagellar biosynthesis chaperone FliJ